MSLNEKTPPLPIISGVAWTVAVVLFYLWNNTGYYGEKIGVFGSFILKILAGG